MCVFIFLFSLIPVLSGYVIYLAVAAVVIDGSPAVRVTLSAISLALLFVGVRWLLRRSRARRLKRVLPDEPGWVDQLEHNSVNTPPMTAPRPRAD